MDFYNLKEVKKLRTYTSNGAELVIIYQKMLLLSLENNGNIYFDEVEETIAEQLHYEFDEKTNDILLTIEFLIKNKLLKEIETGLIFTNFDEFAGKETASARRMRKSRANLINKEINTVSQISQVSHCDRITSHCAEMSQAVTKSDTEKEIELEIDIEKEIKKKEKKKKTLPLAIEGVGDEVLKALSDFEEHRKKIKSPLTEYAKKLTIDEMRKWGYSDQQMVACLKQSIRNGWKGIFEIKENKNNNVENTKSQTSNPFLAKMIRDRENEEKKGIIEEWMM